MTQEEASTRIAFLEKATNRLAEHMTKGGKGKVQQVKAVRKVVQPPEGGIRLVLPAYDVHYEGSMRRVNVQDLENDPDLYAHMRLNHPTIFID